MPAERAPHPSLGCEQRLDGKEAPESPRAEQVAAGPVGGLFCGAAPGGKGTRVEKGLLQPRRGPAVAGTEDPLWFGHFLHHPFFGMSFSMPQMRGLFFW